MLDFSAKTNAGIQRLWCSPPGKVALKDIWCFMDTSKKGTGYWRLLAGPFQLLLSLASISSEAVDPTTAIVCMLSVFRFPTSIMSRWLECVDISTEHLILRLQAPNPAVISFSGLWTSQTVEWCWAVLNGVERWLCKNVYIVCQSADTAFVKNKRLEESKSTACFVRLPRNSGRCCV